MDDSLLLVIGLLLLDFLVTAVGVWLITLVLGAFGLAVKFSMGLAFGVWVILKILKLIT